MSKIINNIFFASMVILFMTSFTFGNAAIFSRRNNDFRVQENDQWLITLGEEGNENLNSVQMTSDGNFIVIGSTDSFGQGSSDLWVAKISKSGSMIWERTYGTSNQDLGHFITETNDAGFLLIGRTPMSGGAAIWILKLYGNGLIEWQKTIGGHIDAYSYSAHETSNGDILVVGYAQFSGIGQYDIVIIKLNSTVILYGKNHMAGMTRRM